ncbi:hypothetical protein [Nitrosopumilus sp.]|uniref:hypothetical protein n=1 Tax=Nitrosopumilus sp. TaxID=2024843 RepID=UPI003B5C48BF
MHKKEIASIIQRRKIQIGRKMAERKNFFLFAIGIGAFGVIIGTYTIWSAVSEIFEPIP